jgi:hypothetical protein
VANGGIVALEMGLDDGSLVFHGVRRWDGAAPDLDDPNA